MELGSPIPYEELVHAIQEVRRMKHESTAEDIEDPEVWRQQFKITHKVPFKGGSHPSAPNLSSQTYLSF